MNDKHLEAERFPCCAVQQRQKPGPVGSQFIVIVGRRGASFGARHRIDTCVRSGRAIRKSRAACSTSSPFGLPCRWARH
jgi:hypothetical protein